MCSICLFYHVKVWKTTRIVSKQEIEKIEMLTKPLNTLNSQEIVKWSDFHKKYS